MNYLTKSTFSEPECAIQKGDYLENHPLGIEESQFFLQKETNPLLKFGTIPPTDSIEYEQETETEEASSQMNDELELRIRDFAYPENDFRHWGEYVEEEERAGGMVYALVRALYDFTAEDSSELGFREGELLRIQYKQCDGWLVAFRHDDMGLIPESYVELVEY